MSSSHRHSFSTYKQQMCLKPVEFFPPLTLLCLLPPCDWLVWHHLTTHQTATFWVPARRSARARCGCQRACWRWPPSPPAPACGHTQKNNVSSAAAGQNCTKYIQLRNQHRAHAEAVNTHEMASIMSTPISTQQWAWSARGSGSPDTQ